MIEGEAMHTFAISGDVPSILSLLREDEEDEEHRCRSASRGRTYPSSAEVMPLAMRNLSVLRR